MHLAGGTWRDLIQATFEAECALLPYRAYPQAAMQQDWSGGERLFEVLFNYMHFRRIADMSRLNWGELIEVTVTSEPTNIPLLISFYVDPVSANVTFLLQYDSGILCAAQAEAIQGYYLAALTALARDASARYETTDILSGQERQDLATYDATATDYPRERVDRRALPSAARAIAVQQPFVAPRTPVEATLAGLWADALGLERVSANDDFFALGGHSLALMRLSLLVYDTFQIEVPLRSLFEAATLVQMAALIAQHLEASGTDSIEPIQQVYQEDDEASLALDQLSDAEVEAFLREALSEEG
jgi:acyl carrier protein